MSDPVIIKLMRESCPVDWMRAALPRDAIEAITTLPPMREHVIGWVSAPAVSIYFSPAIVWRTEGINRDEWWSGLPGSFIALHNQQWFLSHWLPILKGTPR